MGFGDSITPGDIIRRKLSRWLDNPPDYDAVKSAYVALGIVRSDIRMVLRDIEKKEDAVVVDSDKPRSNDTRKAKLAATEELKDKLATLEANEKELDTHVKWLEYQKQMYNAASFQSRQLYD